ncbi:hypothetical protein [Butyrivibrio fibrisolvens]|uniref:hypothetical protein n=1 Tax=Butyrivibrio fibrisolvens TaxID=831 RepID=UPI0012BD49D2|nr:hypothetical protein [Butyrivibrio fibrisolvens]
MPDSFEIKAFLKAHMAEVNNMLQMEYQEKNAKDLIAKANYKKGRDEGIAGTVSILRNMGFDDDIVISKICEQYKISKKEAKKYL